MAKGFLNITLNIKLYTLNKKIILTCGQKPLTVVLKK